ncbi:hypothetical protein MUK42_19253 [Musa troglodytarum]|uniref:Uncharacterized protein n=1 Tax=Musa troglodytarum TaxID=320322 RepID=A0A9E7K2W8_9LILI|nr:hypothetical protein MUK42_19253 [Musa troglodytarum]
MDRKVLNSSFDWNRVDLQQKKKKRLISFNAKDEALSLLEGKRRTIVTSSMTTSIILSVAEDCHHHGIGRWGYNHGRRGCLWRQGGNFYLKHLFENKGSHHDPRHHSRCRYGCHDGKGMLPKRYILHCCTASPEQQMAKPVQSSPLLLAVLLLLLLQSTAIAGGGAGKQLPLGWIPSLAGCRGTIAECLGDGELDLGAVVSRRVLPCISYPELSPIRTPVAAPQSPSAGVERSLWIRVPASQAKLELGTRALLGMSQQIAEKFGPSGKLAQQTRNTKR